jgi:signal transduction histidine kinase
MLLFESVLIVISIMLNSIFFATLMEYKKYGVIFKLMNLLVVVLCIYLAKDINLNYFSTQTYHFRILLVILFFDIIVSLKGVYVQKTQISEYSIKQTVDNSDTGIMVLKDKDRIAMQNSAMYQLIEKLNIKDDYINLIKEKKKDMLDENYIIEIDNQNYLFYIDEAKQEVTAYNIDEEYRLYQEMEEQNRKISENNKNILWTIDNIENLNKEKNILKMKNKFHDILGQRLALLQAFLNQDDNKKDNFEEIKFMIEKMFVELEEDSTAKHNLQDLIRIYSNAGVELKVIGELPKEEGKARVLYEVIREAVTNAIKHANATLISIAISESLEGILLKIKNNGNKSSEVVREHDGIKGMRSKLEKIGGKLTIKTRPEFEIEIRC